MNHFQNKKIDRRVSKTKANIRDALVTLLSQKDIHDITVKELADTANINRKTFYAHYAKLEDIIVEIQDELINKLQIFIDNAQLPKSKLDMNILFTGLNTILNDNFDLYHKLIVSNSYSFILIKVKDVFKNAVLEKLTEYLNLKATMLNLYAEFIATGITSIYVEWFKLEGDMSYEELTNAASLIVYEGLNRIILEHRIV